MSIFSGLWSGGLARNQSILDAQKLALDSEYERGKTAFDQRANDGGVGYNAYLERTGYQGNPQTTQNLSDYAASRNAMNQQQAQRETSYQQNYLGNPQQRAWATGFTSPAAPATAMATPQTGIQQNGRSFGMGLAPQQPQSAMDAWNAAQHARGSQYFATGGVVGMHQGEPRGTDTVPAWLTPGEAVLTPQATQAIGGKPAVDALNSVGKGGLYAAAQQRGLPPVRGK